MRLTLKTGTLKIPASFTGSPFGTIVTDWGDSFHLCHHQPGIQETAECHWRPDRYEPTDAGCPMTYELI